MPDFRPFPDDELYAQCAVLCRESSNIRATAAIVRGEAREAMRRARLTCGIARRLLHEMRQRRMV